MIETKPRLPSVYDLVILETTDSSRAHPVTLKIGDDVISGVFEKMHSDGSIELANAPGIDRVGLINFLLLNFLNRRRHA